MTPIAGIAALLLLAWSGRRLRTPRNNGGANSPPHQARPRPTTAADALEAIGHAALLPQHIEEYCARINDTVRAFLQTHYAIPAISLTARELPTRLAIAGADPGTINMVDSLCTECDAVAYARVRPARARADRYLDLARAIVNPAHTLNDDALANDPNNPPSNGDKSLRPALQEPTPIRQANPDPPEPPADRAAPLTDVRWQRPTRPNSNDEGPDSNDNGGAD